VSRRKKAGIREQGKRAHRNRAGGENRRKGEEEERKRE
jgi:hypothetical protein